MECLVRWKRRWCCRSIYEDGPFGLSIGDGSILAEFVFDPLQDRRMERSSSDLIRMMLSVTGNP